MAVFDLRGKFDMDLQLIPTLKLVFFLLIAPEFVVEASFFLNFDSYNVTNSIRLHRVHLNEKICHQILFEA